MRRSNIRNGGRRTGARTAEPPAGNPSNSTAVREPKSGDALQSVGQTGTAGGNVVSLPTVVGHPGGTLAGDRAVAAGEKAWIEGTPLRPASGRRRIHRRPPRRCRRRPGGGGCRQRSGVSRSHAGDGTDGTVPRSPLRIKSHGPPIRTGQARQNFPALSGLKSITAFPFFGRTATVAAPAILGGGVGHRRPNQRIARRSRPRPADFRSPARPESRGAVRSEGASPAVGDFRNDRRARAADMGAGVGSGFSAEAEGRGGRSPAPHSTMPQAIRETPRPAAAKAASSASRGLRFAPQ